MSLTVQFCRSRNAGRRCTRELHHRGLHRHRTIMWTDAGADAAHCPGSGSNGSPAATLPNGFPDGRALCTSCLGFVEIDAQGALVHHEATLPAEPNAAEWFNTHGW